MVHFFGFLVHGMDIKFDRYCQEHACKKDAGQILIADKKTNSCTREARIKLKQQQKVPLTL